MEFEFGRYGTRKRGVNTLLVGGLVTAISLCTNEKAIPGVCALGESSSIVYFDWRIESDSDKCRLADCELPGTGEIAQAEIATCVEKADKRCQFSVNFHQRGRFSAFESGSNVCWNNDLGVSALVLPVLKPERDYLTYDPASTRGALSLSFDFPRSALAAASDSADAVNGEGAATDVKCGLWLLAGNGKTTRGCGLRDKDASVIQALPDADAFHTFEAGKSTGTLTLEDGQIGDLMQKLPSDSLFLYTDRLGGSAEENGGVQCNQPLSRYRFDFAGRAEIRHPDSATQRTILKTVFLAAMATSTFAVHF